MKNKNLFAFAIILLSSIGLVFAASTQNMLIFENVAGTEASGKVDVRQSIQNDGTHRITVRARVNDLATEAGMIYEGWLIDEETGYKLSIGAFSPNNNGRGTLTFRQNQVNSRIYDLVVITKEPLNDIDPNPATPILVARIPAEEIRFEASLDSRQENSESDSRARGEGLFLLDTEANTLSFEIEYRNLDGVETGAHIHGPAARGEDAGILFTLPLGENKEGVWRYSEAREDEILAGLTYVNVHSDVFPGGEIRGQIELRRH